MARQGMTVEASRTRGRLHRHSLLRRPRWPVVMLVAGLGLCLAAGLPLIAGVIAHQDFLDEHPWLIALTSVAGASLVVAIGIGLLGLVQARGVEIERLE